MAKVHITLVGGQPPPVYIGIDDSKPDSIIYICSDTSKKEAERMKSEFFSLVPSEIIEAHPVDFNEIFLLAEELVEKFDADELIVNVTSGTKPWSLIFFKVFSRHPNCNIIFIDQNNYVWSFSGKKKYMVEFNMDIHLKLYGNCIENNYKEFSAFTEEDKEIAAEIENIRRSNYKDFNSLTILSTTQSNILHNYNLGIFRGDSSFPYIEWEKPKNKNQDGSVLMVMYSRNGEKEYELKSPHVVDLVFNSGWFELKIAIILSKWKKSKEIRMNCRFPFRQGIDKNEVDIIINTGNKLLFVECKTQISQPTDIDKFHSVVKGYGGMGSKALFVTDATMNDMAKNKCNEYDILTFSLKDKDNRPVDLNLLYDMLDAEILKINKR